MQSNFILNTNFEKLSKECIDEYSTKEEHDLISMFCDEAFELPKFAIEKLKKDIIFIDEYIDKNNGKLTKILNHPKENYLIDTINKYWNKRKAIIFVKYVHTGNRLCELLSQQGYNSKLYDGSLTRKQRKECINQFKNEDLQFLICTDSANAGLNLQTTNLLINYDLNWNPQIVEQRIGRIHRIGQQSLEVEIYNLILNDTIDKRIQDLMQSKEETFNDLFDTSDIILGHLAKEYMTKSINDIQLENVVNVSKIEDSKLLEIENEDETQTLNNDYYYMECALQELLMWILAKYNMTYNTKDYETYTIKTNEEEVKLVHLNQVYNMIESESDFFQNFEICPIQSKKIKPLERNIENHYFGTEKQESKNILNLLDKINASNNIRKDINKIIKSCKGKNLLLLNIDVTYLIELNGEEFNRNEFKTIIITPDYKVYTNSEVSRLFYIAPSIASDIKRIETINNGEKYIYMYNQILKDSIIIDKTNKSQNDNISIKDATLKIYNGTIIEID